MTLDLIGAGHHGGQHGHQLNRLAQNVFHGDIVRVLIIGIHSQDRPGQLVHNIGGRRFDDHILPEIARHFPAVGKQLAIAVQLLLGGQTAEQQQPSGFLITEAILCNTAGHQVPDIHATVSQTSFLRRALPLVDHVAVHVADQCESGHHTAAILVAQSALHLIFFKFLRFNPVIFTKLIA